ncbi:hypothetical protein HKCCSP123_09815 [Rhodobacterales bacterium HKCCSP123]|nr:hypothetical protein [Rhodobacterales bacterium HKCCSP123]
MRRTSLTIALALAAGAPAWANGEDLCGASGFQGLVGQSGEIARMLELEQPVRVIPPNSAVTMDYRPDRINFELDDADRIAVVRCG